MLHNVYAALVKAYGWSPRAFTHPEDRQGNVVFLHLVIDALPLQPCEPTLYVVILLADLLQRH
jgi:extracellular elastinolytic metalloproteinase